jgi:trehalose 6-phosphate phosphatase
MSPSTRDVPRLSSRWEQVARSIRASRHVVVFLDFDGTLVRLAPRPDQVHVPAAARRMLRRLARRPRVTLVVISGRRRSDLRRRVGVRGIHYFGLYGAERGGGIKVSSSTRGALRSARGQLALRLSAYPRVWIENKRASFCVHLRDAPPAQQVRVRRELRSVARKFPRLLRLIENLRDAEIVPRRISGKGAAVRSFLAQPRLRRALPIYFGDDLSDESAFAALRRGVTACVGPARPTRAHYSLATPREVLSALGRIGAYLE